MTNPLSTKNSDIPKAATADSSTNHQGRPRGKRGTNESPWLMTTQSAATPRIPVRLGIGGGATSALGADLVATVGVCIHRSDDGALVERGAEWVVVGLAVQDRHTHVGEILLDIRGPRARERA